MVESRTQQIVDQDGETGEWGLTDQIEDSARGHIPSDPQALIQRIEDGQVRQALDRGRDRREINVAIIIITGITVVIRRHNRCSCDGHLRCQVQS